MLLQPLASWLRSACSNTCTMRSLPGCCRERDTSTQVFITRGDLDEPHASFAKRLACKLRAAQCPAPEPYEHLIRQAALEQPHRVAFLFRAAQPRDGSADDASLH